MGSEVSDGLNGGIYVVPKNAKEVNVGPAQTKYDRTDHSRQSKYPNSYYSKQVRTWTLRSRDNNS